MTLDLIAKHQGHPIYFAAGSLADVPRTQLTELPKFFTGAFFLNKTDWDESTLEAAIERVLDAGAVYLMFHGRRCTEACFIADHLITRRFNGEETEKNVIMTTSHENADLQHMAFEVLLLGIPTAEDYHDDWGGYLIISTGSSAENDEVKQVFSNPQESINIALDKDSSSPSAPDPL